MKNLYCALTGGRNLNDFWKMTPRELLEWSAARAMDIRESREEALPEGEEVFD